MPRDGSGVHSLDPGYLAVTGATVLPSNHNPPLEDLSASITESIARTGVTAITANIPFNDKRITGLGDATAAADAMNRQSSDARYNPRILTKSANYTLLAADIGALIIGTGTWTLALLPAATAGDGFSFRVKNNGTGLITIDPDASETINGATTVIAPPGQDFLVVCNGSAWFLVSSSNAAGSIVQSVYAEYTTYFSIDGTATPSQAIPVDDTIPQQTEGVEVLTVSITPQFSTSKLRIYAEIPCAGSANSAIMALFRDSAANAVASDYMFASGGFNGKLKILKEIAASSTSATTIKMRVGPSSGTVGFNGNTAARLLGGSIGARLVVEEIKA